MAYVSCGKYTSIVIFGASGDLAKKKTFPALFGLFREGELPDTIQIIGYARSDLKEDDFKKRISEHFKGGTDEQKQKFLSLCSYHHGQYDKSEDYQKLDEKLDKYEQEHGVVHRIFYLALPPTVFTDVAEKLKENCYPAGLNQDGTPKDPENVPIIRIIIEKPFGHDLKSAQELQKKLAPLFIEDELYRIDHYLGKEMVKNLLVLRFGNEFFNGTWNHKHIKSIQISFKESFGTQGRGGYFDNIGIIRDVMQNHLLQVLTLLTMERPVSFDPEAVRDEKVKVLKAFGDIDTTNLLLGQYTKSEDGKEPGYLDDETVDKKSRAVTYAAIGLEIHNERWEGVPIVMRAGKALDESKVEIRIQYKPVAKGMFKEIQRNELVIRVQPNEAVYLKINSKIPGISTKTNLTDLDLTYATRYSHDFWIPEAYEALIRDCYLGNHSNFVRDDELDVSWKLFTPLLNYIEAENGPSPELYPYGSKGPKGLRKFMTDHDYEFSHEGTYEWPVTTPAKEKEKL